MKADSNLKEVLEDLTIPLSEDLEKREVEFIDGDMSQGTMFGATAYDGDSIKINPKHADALPSDMSTGEELSLIINTESHELEHNCVSSYDVKGFANSYPHIKRTAWYIRNLIEDTYIDYRRTRRNKGLKPVEKKFKDEMFKKEDKITEIDEDKRYYRAIVQLGMAGCVKNIREVEDEGFKHYCAKIHIIFKMARRKHIPEERNDLARRIINIYTNHVDKDIDDLDAPPRVDESNAPETSENESEQNGPESPQTPSTGNQSETTEDCPECGNSDVNGIQKEVDGMVAARMNPPFNTDADWIQSYSFVRNDEVCGYRIVPDGEIPSDEYFEKRGYGLFKANQNYEVLEPANKYEDKEMVDANKCNNCGNEWLNWG